MKAVSVRRVASAAVIVFSATFSIWAQLYTGSISGAVKDPGGESVPNASVTLTNAANGFNFKAQTDASGIFTARSLPPGTYTEKVSATALRLSSALTSLSTLMETLPPTYN